MRFTRPPQKVGQYPQDSEHALVCMTRMRVVVPRPGTRTFRTPAASRLPKSRTPRQGHAVLPVVRGRLGKDR